jgi:hypothetical protein
VVPRLANVLFSPFVSSFSSSVVVDFHPAQRNFGFSNNNVDPPSSNPIDNIPKIPISVALISNFPAPNNSISVSDPNILIADPINLIQKIPWANAALSNKQNARSTVSNSSKNLKRKNPIQVIKLNHLRRK